MYISLIYNIYYSLNEYLEDRWSTPPNFTFSKNAMFSGMITPIDSERILEGQIVIVHDRIIQAKSYSANL